MCFIILSGLLVSFLNERFLMFSNLILFQWGSALSYLRGEGEERDAGGAPGPVGSVQQAAQRLTPVQSLVDRSSPGSSSAWLMCHDWSPGVFIIYNDVMCYVMMSVIS